MRSNTLRCRVAWIGLATLMLWAQVGMAVPPGTQISNVARMTYTRGVQSGLQALSNEVQVLTVANPTPATLEVLAYLPDSSAAEWVNVPTTYYSSSGTSQGPFVLSPLPIPLGSSLPLSLNTSLPLLPVSDFRVDEPVFVRLTDPDQNFDSLALDTVLVSVRSPWPTDAEVLRFVETDPARGVFVGHIQSYRSPGVGAVDGSIAVNDNTVIDLVYIDPTDPGDTAVAQAQFRSAVEQLFMSMRADREVASLGEFVRFTMRVENASEYDLADVQVVNSLPQGVRYQEGSTARDGRSVGDPIRDADGRTLRYTIPALPTGVAVELSYVVQIARTNASELTNSAYAASGSLESNLASATVRLREDLFRTRGIIIGQVRVGDCDSLSGADTGVGLEGVRIYLEDGTAVLTDPRGCYHFEAVVPGTHVVQLDLADLADRYRAVDCEHNNRNAGTSYSQFVELQPGMMWRTDFTVTERMPTPAPKGELELTLDGWPANSAVRYTVTLANLGVPVTAVELSVTLPPGISYASGSAVIGDSISVEPLISERLFILEWDSLAAAESLQVTFDATFGELSAQGELVTQAVTVFGTPGQKRQATPAVTHRMNYTSLSQQSPLPTRVLRHRFEPLGAGLSSEVKNEISDIVRQYEGMEIVRLKVTGHSDSTSIRPRSQRLYVDNYELSRARAESVGRALAAALNLDSAQLTITGAGPDYPIASNGTVAGRARNRRVEVDLIVERRQDRRHQVSVVQSGNRVVVATEGRPSEPTPRDVILPDEPASKMPEFTPAGLDSLDANPSILWPERGFFPPVPSINVAIKHRPGENIRLYLNEQQLDALNSDDRIRSRSGKIELSRWAGIDLRRGTNRLFAVIVDSSETPLDTLTRDIYYSGPPVRAVLVPEQSSLFADGQTPIVVAVRLTDQDGYPARTGVVGEVTVDPPYVLQQERDILQAYPLTGKDMHRNQYEVGPDGLARIRLVPSSRPGEAVMRFHFVDHEQEVRVWLDPKERDWILVGLAEGTSGYHAVSGNLENLSSDSLDDDYYVDGRAAFFAKGRIKGRWLLTVAYDSERARLAEDPGLGRQIDPDAYYTVYGDASDQTYDAPTTGKLYVKMERSSFYTLFGDFSTGLTVTELTRYSRSLRGAKAELHKPGGQFNVFLSESDQAFVKDELPGDGTSGPYQLSRTHVVANSEKVAIETRDRYRSEIIHARRQLRRHVDYSIDYLTGFIFLREPLSERDRGFNRNYVVIDYEASDAGDQTYSYGGRAALRTQSQSLEVGATYIHQGTVGASGNLGGLDATFGLTPATRVRTELAWSESETGSGRVRGRGYVTELVHNGGGLAARVYAREQRSGFGLGQQNASESGTRKLGFEGTRRFRGRLNLKGVGYRQYNLSSGGERDLAQLRLDYSADRWHVRTGFRYVEDRLTLPHADRSQQVTIGGDYWLARDQVRLRLDHEQSVGRNEVSDFPTLTRFGLEYWPVPRVTLFAEQEFSNGDARNSADVRLGVRARPWSGSQLNSSLDHRRSEYGERLYSVLGLRQTVRLSEHWSVDGSLDHTNTISETNVVPFDSAVLSAVGSPENYTAVSAGVARRSLNWSWTSHLELRDGDRTDRFSLATAAYGEPAPGMAMTSAVRVLRNKAAAEDTRAEVRLGAAYRPPGGTWILLNRLDLAVESRREQTAGYDNWRLVYNGNANYVPQAAVQWALQFGAKYVRDKIADEHYSGFTGLLGAELRRDLSPGWDVGLHGSILHSFVADLSDYTVGFSFGRSVVKNSWLSVGYNLTGFRDNDFSAAGYTAAGPFFRFRFKFDQESALEIARALGIAEPENPSANE